MTMLDDPTDPDLGALDTLITTTSESLPAPPFPPPAPSAAPRSRRRGAVAAAAALCAVVSAGVSYATVKATEQPAGGVSYVAVAPGRSSSADSTFDIHALLTKVEPAVVAIEVADSAGSTVTPIGAGSGVIISGDGLLLTNAHVVHATDSNGQPLSDPVFTVKMSDGTVRSAKVLGASDGYDVALMQLADSSGLHPLALADTSTLQVGDKVVAIGNALDLGDAPTVTTGIVSALDRTLRESASVTLRGLIQTDAAINHGNSGGALVNASGELIGINSAGVPDAQNIGFAISVGTIKPLLDQLKAGKSVQVAPIGYIGITLTETPAGITVSTVQDGTPAAGAGIQAGDVITKVGSTTVATANQLQNVLRALAPGTKVDVTLRRAGATKVVSLTLAARPTN